MLKVEGINLGNCSFLALRVVGHSLPEDYLVHALHIHKENDTESELTRFPKLRREIHEVTEGQALAVTQESMADQDSDINVIKIQALKF